MPVSMITYSEKVIREDSMDNVYSLRIYDTELMRFVMEKRGLEGLVTEILDIKDEYGHLI